MKPVNSFFLLLFAVVLSSGSCRKGGPCEEPPDIKTASSIIVNFIDKQTEKYLYAEINPLYNKDSLTVIDSTGDRLYTLFTLTQIPNSLSRYYRVTIGPVYNFQTDGNSFNTEICKNFYIGYNSNEKDTVRVCFKAKSTKCGSVFETLKVFHKDSLIGSNSENTSILIHIYKN